MKLKAFLKTLDGLNEAFHELYEKTDEGFVLIGIEEKEYKTKIDEFRGNNNNLKKQVEELGKQSEKYKDVDPEKYKEMQTKINELTDKNLMDTGKVDELIEQRTERMRTEYADKFKKLEERATQAEGVATEYKNSLNSITVNDAVTTQVFSAYKLADPAAINDVLARASKVWKVEEDGKLVAKNSNGEIIYGKDGKDPLSMKEWVESVNKDASYLFQPNTGGGAQGSGQPRPGIKYIDHNDKDAFSKNLEDIASGKMEVRQ